MRGVAVLLCFAALGAAGAAETSVPLPAGLAALWRVDGRKLDVAIAPDGRSFVYATGAGRTYSALARVPR